MASPGNLEIWVLSEYNHYISYDGRFHMPHDIRENSRISKSFVKRNVQNESSIGIFLMFSFNGFIDEKILFDDESRRVVPNA